MKSRLALCASLAASAAACGGGHHAAFCGLVRAQGFQPVEAVRGVSCANALAAVRAGARDWTCSRAMHAAYELDCRDGARELQVLERTPLRAKVHGGVVTLANWSFRLVGRRLEARSAGAWVELPGPPFCIPDAPREALVALRLHALTAHGGCFTSRRRVP